MLKECSGGARGWGEIMVARQRAKANTTYRDVGCANQIAFPGFEFMHTLALFARWPSALSKSNEPYQTLLLYVGRHAAPSPGKAYSSHHGLQSGSSSSRLTL